VRVVFEYLKSLRIDDRLSLMVRMVRMVKGEFQGFYTPFSRPNMSLT
jgi:hypothetical protein